MARLGSRKNMKVRGIVLKLEIQRCGSGQSGHETWGLVSDV